MKDTKAIKIGLKPCPFCGGEVVRLTMLDSSMDAYKKATRYFGCRRCAVVSFCGMTDAEAISAWNRRKGR